MSNTIKKIGILTSGGDAPGMNCAIRAVVRTAINNGIQVFGISRGYEGLLNGEIAEMTSRDVSSIMFRGGTILLTARSNEMMTEESVKKAANLCKLLKFDALIVLGGDGSLKGGLELSKNGVNIMGIPCTIDLDLDCTDYTIGFDTAVNTSLNAADKIRDTSTSHERCSVIEVMGRGAGFIALWTGLSGGAEEIIIPERESYRNIYKSYNLRTFTERRFSYRKRQSCCFNNGFKSCNGSYRRKAKSNYDRKGWLLYGY